MPREKSAGAIIFKMENGVPHYLLLHYPGINRKGGHWEFAKGHVEQGEREADTVRREVLEETGIRHIKLEPGFKQYIKYFFKRKAVKGQKVSWVFKLVVFFLAEAKTKQVTLSPEHTEFLWLPFEQAFKKTTYKNSKELLKKADKFLRENKI